MTPKSICPSCRELAAGVCDARQDEGHDDGIGPSRCAERIRSLPTHPEGELSGEQIEEIHEWLTVLPFAENMKAAQAKHIEQMNALCNMALRTHDLQARLDAAVAAVIAMAEDGWLFFGPEGMSEAQEKCLAAYLLFKPENAIKEYDYTKRDVLKGKP